MHWLWYLQFNLHTLDIASRQEYMFGMNLAKHIQAMCYTNSIPVVDDNLQQPRNHLLFWNSENWDWRTCKHITAHWQSPAIHIRMHKQMHKSNYVFIHDIWTENQKGRGFKWQDWFPAEFVLHLYEPYYVSLFRGKENSNLVYPLTNQWKKISHILSSMIIL